MASRLFSVVAILAVGGALVAGCGSSSNSSSSTAASSPAASSTSSASTPATSTPSSSSSSSSSGGGGTNSAVAAAAKQGCDAAVSNNPALDPSKRSALSADCQKVADAAASGDKTKLKAAYGSFCNDLVGALPSAAQAVAKPACEQAANSIQ
jgi:hypothetical protein